MFQGLMLTSLTVLVARNALFQRKSRSGFLDELDEIRSDALATDETEGDLWTDLREGGEYSDPHEIAGLYADDSTPDQPRRADRKPPRREPAPAPEPKLPEPELVVEPDPVVVPDPVVEAEPVVAEALPPPPPPPPAALPPPPPPTPTAAPIEAAPHPVRPSEMWHSADGAPAVLGEQLAPIEPAPVAAASFETATLPPAVDAPAPTPAPASTPAPVDPFEAEAPEPSAAASAAEPIVEFSGGLVPGPVGRRNRRDRPDSRSRASLPPAIETRTPQPATLPEPIPTPEPAPTPEEASEPIIPAPDGMVGVSGVLVRVDPEFQGEVRRADGDPTVTLRQGWCWVAPGEGDPKGVVVDLPNSRLVAEAGSTVLCVVEADGSSFVIVAAGSTTLGRDDDVAPLLRGSIVMIDPTGGAQIDQAEPPEIEADPLVSANLALDAEL